MLLQGSRGKGELPRAGRTGAELTALPLFVAGEIGSVFFQLSTSSFLHGEKEFRGLTDGLLRISLQWFTSPSDCFTGLPEVTIPVTMVA